MERDYLRATTVFRSGLKKALQMFWVEQPHDVRRKVQFANVQRLAGAALFHVEKDDWKGTCCQQRRWQGAKCQHPLVNMLGKYLPTVQRWDDDEF